LWRRTGFPQRLAFLLSPSERMWPSQATGFLKRCFQRLPWCLPPLCLLAEPKGESPGPANLLLPLVMVDGLACWEMRSQRMLADLATYRYAKWWHLLKVRDEPQSPVLLPVKNCQGQKTSEP